MKKTILTLGLPLIMLTAISTADSRKLTTRRSLKRLKRKKTTMKLQLRIYVRTLSSISTATT
jgi:hypothetical protein